MQDLKQRLKSARAEYGMWTAHNIEVAPGTFTVGRPGTRRDDGPFLGRAYCQQVTDILRKPFSDLRVLDLGCLEGLYTIEMALQGAKSVGIDARQASIAKANFAKNALKLDGAEFFVDDVRNVTEKMYGKFDVILCLGLLYHLDFPDVFYVLQQLRGMCRGLMILDTHISLFPHEKQDLGDKTYWGWKYDEHAAHMTQQEREKNMWASIDNEKSFWPTRASLANMMADAGFTTVNEMLLPCLPDRHSDRATFVAIAGELQDHKAVQTPAEILAAARWQEQDQKFFPNQRDERVQQQFSSTAYKEDFIRRGMKRSS